MAKDVDDQNPADAAQARAEQHEAGQPDAAAEPDDPAHAATTEPDDREPEPDDTAERAVVAASKGRTGAFLALTCGFLLSLCCLGGCFVGVAVGVTRTANLETALATVGEPDGWKTTEQTVRPWRVSATLSGPDSARAVAGWLDELGETVSRAEVTDCLAAEDGCDAEATVSGFTVTVHYGPADGGAEATVQIA